ncbi:hypothetical protein D3C80_1886320 [compost metagenome]
MGRTLQCLFIGRRMNTTDQKPLSSLVLQKINRSLNSGLATGENDDGIGRLIDSRRLHAGDLFTERDEADEKRQKNNK